VNEPVGEGIGGRQRIAATLRATTSVSHAATARSMGRDATAVSRRATGSLASMAAGSVSPQKS
jgi:hypothetical protein